MLGSLAFVLLTGTAVVDVKTHDLSHTLAKLVFNDNQAKDINKLVRGKAKAELKREKNEKDAKKKFKASIKDYVPWEC